MGAPARPRRTSSRSTIPRRTSRATAGGRSHPAWRCRTASQGAALFADISGFTPLTEALANELGSQRGSEELTGAPEPRLPRASSRSSTATAATSSTSAATRSPAGSTATTALRADACGLAMQEAMARVGEIVTPAGSRVQLALKVAVAVGEARRFVVGDPDIQLIDVLAGRLIDASRRRRASRREGRGRARRVGARVPRRPRQILASASRRGAARAWASSAAASTVAVDNVRQPSEAPLARRARPPVAPARRLRAAADRSRRVPRRAPAGIPGVRALRRASTTTTTTTRSTKLDDVRARARSGSSRPTAATCCS